MTGLRVPDGIIAIWPLRGAAVPAYPGCAHTLIEPRPSVHRPFSEIRNPYLTAARYNQFLTVREAGGQIAVTPA